MKTTTRKAHPEDILWWAKQTNRTLFTEAAKQIRAADGPVEVLWPKNARRLIVRPLPPVKAVRKRSRRA